MCRLYSRRQTASDPTAIATALGNKRMTRSLLLLVLPAMLEVTGSLVEGQSTASSTSASAGSNVLEESSTSDSDDYCDPTMFSQSSLSFYLSLPQLSSCSEQSDYNVLSGLALTYQQAVSICGIDDCMEFFSLIPMNSSTPDCRLPFGMHFYWRADLVDYVLDVCAELGSSSGSGSVMLDPVIPPVGTTSSDYTGSVVPIVVGVTAGVAILLGLLWFFWRKRKGLRKDLASNEHEQRDTHELYVAILSNIDAANGGSACDGNSVQTDSTSTPASNSAASTTPPLSTYSRKKRALQLSDLTHWRVDVDSIQDLERIGRGAYGVVWRVLYRNTTILASKRIQADQITPERSQDFIEEILLISQLQHPNIVEFIGVAWTMEVDLQVLLEFMNRGDLRSHLIQPETPRTWTREKLLIALDIAQALVFLHSFRPPLVHRDLKSHNVMLRTTTAHADAGGTEASERLTAKLTDFGVSRFHSESNTMTIGVGTSWWLAPEVILGKSNYGAETDIYSFGVVLSELDTHELPYDAARTDAGDPLPNVAILQRVAMGLLKPTFHRETCIPAVLELAQRCLLLDGSERPTATQVAYELRTIIKLTDLER